MSVYSRTSFHHWAIRENFHSVNLKLRWRSFSWRKRAKEHGWRVRRNPLLCAQSPCCTSFRNRSINIRSIIADVVEGNNFDEVACRLAIWTQNSNISIGDKSDVLVSWPLQTLLLTVVGWVTALKLPAACWSATLPSLSNTQYYIWIELPFYASQKPNIET
jgi:hypothetical protein